MRHDNDYLRELMNELTGGDAMVSANVCMAIAEAYAEGFLDWLAVEDDSQVPGVAGVYLVKLNNSTALVRVADVENKMRWMGVWPKDKITHCMPYKIEMPK